MGEYITLEFSGYDAGKHRDAATRILDNLGIGWYSPDTSPWGINHLLKVVVCQSSPKAIIMLDALSHAKIFYAVK